MKKLCIVMMACLMLLSGCDTNKVPKNTVHSVEDLKGKKVGVQIRTTGDECATNLGGLDVQRFNRITDAVDALRDGEIDAAILDDGTANAFVKEYGDLRILGDACEGETYGIIVKKGNTELLSKVNTALNTIQENGTLDHILKSWLSGEEQESAYERQKSGPYKNGTLVVVTNAEFPPFESKLNDKLVGIDIDIIEAVCDELDMDLELQDIAFDSVISFVDRGMADVGISAMSITDERKEKVDFSEPYANATQVVLIRK